MSNPAIEVCGLSKRYRLGGERPLGQRLRAAGRRLLGGGAAKPEEFWALRDVSFTVERGEVVGIIGRNGAGKSTLLKILSQITAPTSGYAKVRGRMGSLLEVGTGFHPELTGRENIFLNGAILGMSRGEIRRKLDEIVDFSGVESFLYTPVKRYSSGMRVRLAFAVAAHLEPEVLVVDEVLAVGDADFQERCLGKMQSIADRSGRTILFVSHQLAAVQRLCRRSVLLQAGGLLADGPTSEVIQQYHAQREGEGHGRVVVLDAGQACEADAPVTVESVELLNAVGDRFACTEEEPLRLRLRLRVHQPCPEPTLAIGCRTRDQLPVFTVHSTGSPALGLRQPGRHAVDVVLRHALRPGAYQLMLGVSIGPRVLFYDTVASAELLPGPRSGGVHHGGGLIHCEADWRRAATHGERSAAA